MVRQDVKELSLKIANDIHNGYDDADAVADLRAAISWWSCRYAELAIAARAVEGAAVVLDVCAKGDERIPAKHGREILAASRKRLDEVLSA